MSFFVPRVHYVSTLENETKLIHVFCSGNMCANCWDTLKVFTFTFLKLQKCEKCQNLDNCQRVITKNMQYYWTFSATINDSCSCTAYHCMKEGDCFLQKSLNVMDTFPVNKCSIRLRSPTVYSWD